MQHSQETYNEFMASQPQMRCRLHYVMKTVGIGLTQLATRVPANFLTLRKFLIEEKETDYKTLVKIEKWLKVVEKEIENE